MQRLTPEIKDLLFQGTAIPAYPLALNEDKSWDELSQRTLTHYYIDSGVGGLAVGVHTTQFEIREFGLYETVLRTAIEEIAKRDLNRPFIKIAGVCGDTPQAVAEATLARDLGYDIVLLSMGNLHHLSEDDHIARAQAVANIMPVCGFYLQPSAGGRIFPASFWERFVDIDNVVAFKTAPFNRYQTLDVIKAVLNSKRVDEIALYTGNDDNIVADLLTTYSITKDGKYIVKDIVGGLLGHWAVWTQKSVQIFNTIKEHKKLKLGYDELLELGTHITDSNAAFFDVRNGFKGCIAGINEVLARQGLLKGNWCLLDKECLSEGQSEYIDEVYANYPTLSDDAFVKENLAKWRAIAAQK